MPHRETDIPPEDESSAHKVIQPELISFISYPYEWCFSQLKAAALTTLCIQKIALQFGMILRDASAYNIQFRKGKPILIDTLSFVKYQDGQPWNAYKQFCQHFLAPLALMALTDVRLNQLSRIYIDGIPLDLASALLPIKSRFSFGILSHIHLHAKSQKHFSSLSFPRSVQSSLDGIKRESSLSEHPLNLDLHGKAGNSKSLKVFRQSISKTSLTGIIDNLESTVQKLTWQPQGTEWGDYYDDTNYSPAAQDHKKEIIQDYLNQINPKSVWDMGANTGMFSRLASERGIETISFDIDPAAIEKNYQEVCRNNEQALLPLCLDFLNPSPGIGWDNNERSSLQDRGPADAILALALIHHVAISNNVPLGLIAASLSRLCRFLIIEFVPKNDSQVQRLFRTREDIFPAYDQERFEQAFSHHFLILKSRPVPDTLRIIYLMRAL